MAYISLVAEAALVLTAAENRLAKAKQTLQDFLTEHQDQAVSPELARSLEREKETLIVELDAAHRFFHKCCEDLAELKAGVGER